MRNERSDSKTTAVDLVVDSIDLGENQVSTEWKDGFFSRGVVRLRNLRHSSSGDLEARPFFAYTEVLDESGNRLLTSESMDPDDIVAFYTYRKPGVQRVELVATKRKLFWLERLGGYKAIAHEIRRTPSPSDLVGVSVTATRHGGGYTETTTTDSLGRYSFLNVPAGTYTLTFSRPPDLSYTKEVTV